VASHAANADAFTSLPDRRPQTNHASVDGSVGASVRPVISVKMAASVTDGRKVCGALTFIDLPSRVNWISYVAVFAAFAVASRSSMFLNRLPAINWPLCCHSPPKLKRGRGQISPLAY
jgi:hypothetical protein